MPQLDAAGRTCDKCGQEVGKYYRCPLCRTLVCPSCRYVFCRECKAPTTGPFRFLVS